MSKLFKMMSVDIWMDYLVDIYLEYKNNNNKNIALIIIIIP